MPLKESWVTDIHTCHWLLTQHLCEEEDIIICKRIYICQLPLSVNLMISRGTEAYGVNNLRGDNIYYQNSLMKGSSLLLYLFCNHGWQKEDLILSRALAKQDIEWTKKDLTTRIIVAQEMLEFSLVCRHKDIFADIRMKQVGQKSCKKWQDLFSCYCLNYGCRS